MNLHSSVRSFACALFLAAGASAYAAVLTAVGESAFAADPHLTYDDGVWFDPVDGQTIGGVVHGFTVGGSTSADALIDILPGVTDRITPFNIEGTSSGALSLTFGTAQTRIGFNWLLQGSGGTVQLFDSSGALLGSTDFSGTTDSVTGGQTGFAGVESDTAFTRALVSWSGDGRFAFDDLRFGGGGAPVPLPGTLALLAAGAALMGAARRRRT